MANETVKAGYTVHMNQRDVTPWTTSVEPGVKAGTLYGDATVTFAAWSALEPDAKWNIYGTYDPANPRAVLLLREGITPEDRERMLRLAAGAIPSLTVRIFDPVWLAQRRGPDDTIVMLPGSAGDDTADALIANYGEAVGRTVLWRRVNTMHQAVTRLARAAKINVRVLLPDYELAPYVVNPRHSYWKAILELVRPWAPDPVIFRNNDNTLVIADSISQQFSVGRRIKLPANTIAKIEGKPVTRARVRRLILRIPKT
jgi:hypothetical protein